MLQLSDGGAVRWCSRPMSPLAGGRRLLTRADLMSAGARRQMPRKPDGPDRRLPRFPRHHNDSLARTAQLKTKGPGACAAVDVQVTVMPKMTIFSEPL